jgi:hypothetical protein
VLTKEESTTRPRWQRLIAKCQIREYHLLSLSISSALGVKSSLLAKVSCSFHQPVFHLSRASTASALGESCLSETEVVSRVCSIIAAQIHFSCSNVSVELSQKWQWYCTHQVSVLGSLKLIASLGSLPRQEPIHYRSENWYDMLISPLAPRTKGPSSRYRHPLSSISTKKSLIPPSPNISNVAHLDLLIMSPQNLIIRPLRFSISTPSLPSHCLQNGIHKPHRSSTSLSASLFCEG